MAGKKSPVSIGLNSELLSKIDAMASEAEISRSMLVEEALEFYTSLEQITFLRGKARAAVLQIPYSVIWQTLLVKWLEDINTDSEVYGDSPKILSDFALTSRGWLVGIPLHERFHRELLEKKIAAKITFLVSNEKAGIPLSADDKKFLIEHQVGQAWLDSEEYKNIQAEIDQALKAE